MKIGFRWSDRDGEGRMSKADYRAIIELLAEGDIEAFDFMQDCAHAMIALYIEGSEIYHDALEAKRRMIHGEPPLARH